MELKDLVGLHDLTGVWCGETTIDRFGDGSDVEQANDMRFIIDGGLYIAVEDPCDGYRSCMKELRHGAMEDMCGTTNIFPSQRVYCHMGNDDDNEVLYMRNVDDGEVIVAVGTDHADDYYPTFKDTFTPENMTINKGR